MIVLLKTGPPVISDLFLHQLSFPNSHSDLFGLIEHGPCSSPSFPSLMSLVVLEPLPEVMSTFLSTVPLLDHPAYGHYDI